MNTAKPSSPKKDRNSVTSQYRVGCDEPDVPYTRMQAFFLRFLGLVLGRQLI